jgi:hypothetical protein
MLQRFLSKADAERVLHVFQKLTVHDIRRWAVTGGLAVELHHVRLGAQPSLRPLNDLDFITGSFDCIPETLADEFLFRHIHPLDPPGKTILQFVDADNALRMDVFRAYGETMDRTCGFDFPSGRIRLISLEDLVAREARLTLDIAQGIPVLRKHAKDFLRLLELTEPEEVEGAWQGHRRPMHPVTFKEACSVLRALIPSHPELLVDPDYSKDTQKSCLRCKPTPEFHLASLEVILSLLGYV